LAKHQIHADFCH